MKKLFILFLLVAASFLYSQNRKDELLNTVMTRNLDPLRFPEQSYREFRAANPLRASTHQERNYLRSDTRTAENFLIIVEERLYNSMLPYLTTYQSDLSAENLNSYLITFTGSDHVALKNVITGYYNDHSIVGAILIGNLPAGWYEFPTKDDDGEWTGLFSEFPCDLYLADTNGVWTDADDDGLFDSHTVNTHPELWLGRIRADNLPGAGMTEFQMLTGYFQRNHLFRHGLISSSDTALAYVDEDWKGSGPIYKLAMQNVYPNTELINASLDTNVPDYKLNRLPADYDFIQVMVHSSPTHHTFVDVPTPGDTIRTFIMSYELPPIYPTAKFYNLFACSNAKFTEVNCMGSMYLLGNDHALNVIGTTKTGSMLNFATFYQPLQTMTFGGAYKDWWENNINVNVADWEDISWFYGNLLLGDPTLYARYFFSAEGITWTGATSEDWNVASNWSNNQVPNSQSDVFIPNRLTNYPHTSSAVGHCRNITILPGAEITIANPLLIYEDFNIYGTLIMEDSSAELWVSRDIFWKAGSEAQITNSNAKIFCKRGMTFEYASNVQMTQGTVNFFSGGWNPEVDYDAFILNRSSSTQLCNIISDKQGYNALVLSGSSTEPFTINGDLRCWQNRRIIVNYDGDISLQGNLISENTNATGIYWNNGALKLTGTNQSIAIPHNTGYLHDLWAANTGTVSSSHALWLKGNLQVNSTAEIIINSSDLTVDGLTDFNGKLVMNTAEGKLRLIGSSTWKASSSVEINSDSAEIFCKGSMTLESGSDFNMIRGSVEFYGDNDRIIVNNSYNTKFHHLRINKSDGAALAISASSTKEIYITGDFTNNQNSIFRSYYTGYVLVKGNFSSLNSNSEGINWEAGTLVLNGPNPYLSLAHAGDYLFSLRSYPTVNTYLSSNIILKGDFSHLRGVFFAGGYTISVGGDWTIQSGAVFAKGTSSVIFNGTETQYVSSTSFNILRLDKADGGADNKLVIISGKVVSAVSYKYEAGTIEVSGGSFTVADLADVTVKGNYVISAGLISLTQDSQYFVDLDANLTITGGRVSLQGGFNYPADFAHTREVSITMSAGVLDFNSRSIGITNSGHALNLMITGGTIRTAGSFVNGRTGANFAGGTIELYGNSDATLSNSGDGSFYDVKINKAVTRSEGEGDRANKVTIDQSLTVSRDLTVWSGTLAMNGVTVNVGRDMYVSTVFQMNNTGAVLNIGRDFVCGGNSNVEITRGTINITRNLSQMENTPLLSSSQNTINFVGTGDSSLSLMNPTASLGNIGINKSSGTVGISTSAAALNLLGNMTVSVGNQFMFRTIPTVIAGALNVNGSILLQSEGSVTCYDLNMYGDITVAGDLIVQHDYYQAPATQLIVSSSGDFIIDKPFTGNYQSFVGTTILNGGAITITNEGIQFGATSALTINSGSLKIGGGLRAMVPSSFQMSTGAIEFIGSRYSEIQLAEGNYPNNVVVSKTGTGTVILAADLMIRDLMINSGTFLLFHRTLNIAGNLNIMAGTLDAAYADDLINLSGWWNNNRSPLGFTQGLGTVAFVGSQRSVIYQTEQFNNLIVNKTGAYPDGVEVETGATLSANNIEYLDGMIYLKGGSTLNTPAAGLTIAPGCALSCDPITPSTINLNGDFTDQNMSVDANMGFSSGKSVINAIDSGDRQFNTWVSPLILNDLNINLSSGIFNLNSSYIKFLGNLSLQSGTLQHNMGATVECYQNLNSAAGTNFNLECGMLSLIGSQNSTFGFLGASNFSGLTINKSVSTATVGLSSDWIAPDWCYVNVQKGILQLNGNALCINGNLQINDGGTLLVDAGAELSLGNNNILDVFSGGKLSVLGTAANPAVITRAADAYYSLNINSGGSIAAEHAIFEYMDYGGVNINSGATVDPEFSFNNCTFRNSTYGSSLLNINNSQNLTINNAVFPANTWDGTSNVSKTENTGSIRFLNESGDFAGAGYESDPFSRINWNSQNPAIAVNQNTLSFGNVYIPMSEYRSFTITNSGSGSLAGTLNVPDDFTASIYRTVNSESKADNPQRSTSIYFIVLPGSSIQVQVSFIPTQPLSYNATLVISHNATGNPINISLTGYGMGTQITVNPTEIIKGILPGGSHTETLSITDSGNASLSYYASVEYPSRDRAAIMSESFETGFPPTGWSTAQVNGTAGSWNGNATTHYPAGSSPQDGSYLAYFNSYSSEAGSQTRLQTSYLNFSDYSSISLSFWMYHEEGYPERQDRLQVQVMSNQQWVNVGEPILRAVAPYNEWRKHTISLSAYGNTNYVTVGLVGISEYGNDIHIDNVVITGSNPPTGWVCFNGQYNYASGVIAPGNTDQHAVTISTYGMEPGTYQAEIHIGSDDPITTIKIVPITVSVGSPGINVNPAAIAFGNQIINTFVTQNVSITATGELHLSGTISVPSGYSVQAATSSPSFQRRLESRNGAELVSKASASGRWSSSVAYTLSPGETQTYQVRFTPTAQQAYNGNLNITSDHLAAQVIPLSGTGANIPTVQTLAANAITGSSATLNAQITSSGGLELYGRGFKYGTDPNPISNGSDYFVSGTNNTYSAYPTGFASGQQIFFCAFAHNELGWAYGEILSFNTLNPQLTVSPTSLTDFGAVMINTSSEPKSFTVSGSDLSGTVGLNASVGFRISLNSGRRAERATTDQITLYPVDGVLPETTIYVFFEPTAVQPYTGNVSIITPGVAEVNVSLSGTGITVPTLTAIEVAEITQTSAISGGNITDNGGNAVTARGVCWSESPAPTLADAHSSDGEGSGVFSSQLSDLLPGTQYFVRAYATNLAGTVYSEAVTFITTSSPLVSASLTEIESFGSVIVGEVSASESFIVAGSGLSANLLVTAPTGFQITLIGRDRQRDYSSEISISPSSGSVFETILLRFAPLSGGAYSDSIVISSSGAENVAVTVSGIGITKPVLSTKPITDILSNSARSGGTISSDGYSRITVCGICWSLSPEPTTADFSRLKMPAITDYSLEMNNLLPNTTYFVRAFAINAAGTAYGNEISFSTSVLALSAPTNLRIAIVAGTAQLSWDTVQSAVSYKIYRSLNPYASDWGAPVAITTDPMWADLAVSGRYFYRVVASTEVARELTK